MFFADGDWFQILAALIFFAITGLAQWVQKRAQARREGEPSPSQERSLDPLEESGRETPPLSSGPRASPSTDWEEQLRRLLQGDSPQARQLPPTLPGPPPVVVSSSRVEPDETRSWEDSEAPTRELVSLKESRAAIARASGIEAAAGKLLTSASRMSSASIAYTQASNLHEYISNRLRSAIARTESPSAAAPVSPRRDSGEAARLLGILQRPETARQAFVASIVFQSPKGLDPGV